MTNFQDYEKISKEEGIGKSGGDWMKLKDGENKVRFVTESQAYGKHYVQAEKKNYVCIGEKCILCSQGVKKQTRFISWVIDREDGQIKLLEIGWQIFKQMGELSKSSEYGFKDLPPFDIIIKKKGEGLDTEYFIQPARKETKLTDEEKKEVKKLTSPELIVKKMLEKNPSPSLEDPIDREQEDQNREEGEEEIDLKEIPF